MEKSRQRKAYRFRLEPNRAQAEGLSRQAGARRFVWNWALERRRAYHAEHGKGIPVAQLSAELTQLKQQPETAWLTEIDAQLCQQVLRDLELSYRRFFTRKARYPRFKSRKRDTARFRIPQRVKLAEGKIYCPKVGWIKARQSREVGPGETIKSATFKQTSTGHWFVTLVAEFQLPDVSPAPLSERSRTVGIDLGLKSFATLSDGCVIESPKAYRRLERKLKREQRRLCRKRLGSANRAKQRVKVARVHEKIRNTRTDFLHKATTNLVNEYDVLLIEDLSVKGLARTKLAKSIHDASFGEFRRQLEYKALWQRKHLQTIGRFYPSSKLCGDCGLINDTLTLADRQWACEGCGTIHDRDLNAARNIEREGLRLIHVAAGQAETLNACGANVRPSTRADGETRLLFAA